MMAGLDGISVMELEGKNRVGFDICLAGRLANLVG